MSTPQAKQMSELFEEVIHDFENDMDVPSHCCRVVRYLRDEFNGRFLEEPVNGEGDE